MLKSIVFFLLPLLLLLLVLVDANSVFQTKDGTNYTVKLFPTWPCMHSGNLIPVGDMVQFSMHELVGVKYVAEQLSPASNLAWKNTTAKKGVILQKKGSIATAWYEDVAAATQEKGYDFVIVVINEGDQTWAAYHAAREWQSSVCAIPTYITPNETGLSFDPMLADTAQINDVTNEEIAYVNRPEIIIFWSVPVVVLSAVLIVMSSRRLYANNFPRNWNSGIFMCLMSFFLGCFALVWMAMIQSTEQMSSGMARYIITSFVISWSACVDVILAWNLHQSVKRATSVTLASKAPQPGKEKILRLIVKGCGLGFVFITCLSTIIFLQQITAQKQGQVAWYAVVFSYVSVKLFAAVYLCWARGLLLKAMSPTLQVHNGGEKKLLLKRDQIIGLASSINGIACAMGCLLFIPPLVYNKHGWMILSWNLLPLLASCLLEIRLVNTTSKKEEERVLDQVKKDAKEKDKERKRNQSTRSRMMSSKESSNNAHFEESMAAGDLKGSQLEQITETPNLSTRPTADSTESPASPSRQPSSDQHAV